MTPGVVESFNPKSDLIANTPCVEEYFISKISSQQQNFESPINEQELLLSNQKKEQQSITELKESVNEIESDSSDDDEDEDYEEEFKGNVFDHLVSIDIVPSPEHVPQFYNQNKKNSILKMKSLIRNERVMTTLMKVSYESQKSLSKEWITLKTKNTLYYLLMSISEKTKSNDLLFMKVTKQRMLQKSSELKIISTLQCKTN